MSQRLKPILENGHKLYLNKIPQINDELHELKFNKLLTQLLTTHNLQVTK